MSGKYGRDLPATVRREICNMVLAVQRKQLTQERAMQEIAYYCLEAGGYFKQMAEPEKEQP